MTNGEYISEFFKGHYHGTSCNTSFYFGIDLFLTGVDEAWINEEYKPETLADVNLDLCLKAREETKELEDRHERLKARYKRLFKRYYRLYHDRQIALINKITELGEEIEVLHTRNAEYQLEAARWKRMYQGLCESIIDTVKDSTFGERR